MRETPPRALLPSRERGQALLSDSNANREIDRRLCSTNRSFRKMTLGGEKSDRSCPRSSLLDEKKAAEICRVGGLPKRWSRGQTPLEKVMDKLNEESRCGSCGGPLSESNRCIGCNNLLCGDCGPTCDECSARDLVGSCTCCCTSFKSPDFNRCCVRCGSLLCESCAASEFPNAGCEICFQYFMASGHYPNE